MLLLAQSPSLLTWLSLMLCVRACAAQPCRRVALQGRRGERSPLALPTLDQELPVADSRLLRPVSVQTGQMMTRFRFAPFVRTLMALFIFSCE